MYEVLSKYGPGLVLVAYPFCQHNFPPHKSSSLETFADLRKGRAVGQLTCTTTSIPTIPVAFFHDTFSVSFFFLAQAYEDGVPVLKPTCSALISSLVFLTKQLSVNRTPDLFVLRSTSLEAGYLIHNHIFEYQALASCRLKRRLWKVFHVVSSCRRASVVSWDLKLLQKIPTVTQIYTEK